MSKRRILLKAITWRIASVVITLTLARAFNMPAVEAGAFAFWHAILSTGAFLAHEAVWARRK